jgi:hypothetical protein
MSWRSAIVGATLLASGCATSTEAIQAPKRTDLSAGVRRGTGRDIVLLAPFVDRRDDKCDILKRGFGWTVYRYRCAPPPGELYAQLLADALTDVGYHVTNDLKAAGPSTLIVSAAVERTLVEPVFKFFFGAAEADIQVSVGVSTKTGLRAKRSFYVKGTDAFFADANGSAQLAFASAAREATLDIVGAIVNLDEAPR